VRDGVRHDFQHDRITQRARGGARLVERDHVLLGDDGHAGGGEQALGVALVNSRASARGEECRHASARSRRRAQRAQRLAPAGEAIDGAEALPRAADQSNAVLAQKVRLVAPEDAGAHGHEVEGLRGRFGARGQQPRVLQHAARRADGLVVEAVAAQRDRVEVRLGAQHLQRMGEILRVVAIAPRIERVAVARERAHDALHFGAGARR
jgi:hypothetical protein